MLATVYLYLGKKGEHPGPVCVRREEGWKHKGKKVFVKILRMGEGEKFLEKF
jgi:hypothetical protein